MDLYLLHSFPVGSDGDFSIGQATHSYNAHLANNIGNLLNRFLVLTLKIGGGVSGTASDAVFLADRANMEREYVAALGRCDLRAALEAVFQFADTLNKYLDTKRPWELVSDESRHPEVADVLLHLGEGLYAMACMLMPFFPAKMEELLARIGRGDDVHRIIAGSLPLDAGIPFASRFEVAEKGVPLFARIDVSK